MNEAWLIPAPDAAHPVPASLDPRKGHTDEFKAKVALEALKGVRTLSELSAAFEVHPTVIAQ